MATIYIDDAAYDVEDGDNILQACLSHGLDLPYFCWHPAMGSIGACRQCAVVQYRDAEDTRGRIVMGCMTPVSDGARFSLAGDKASGFRKNIVESLMINHPHDCPVCGEGGECHLQDMTVMVGHRDRHYRGNKITHRNQYLGPLIHHEMNRCITCYRCTRYYNDYAGGKDLAAMAAHDHVYFGRHQPGILESEFAGNLVEVCPTGVFTDKTLVHDYTRKWDLQSAPSICTGCAVGCNTSPGERYGSLKRVHNRFNVEVNGYFLCDRGRFGAGHVNAARRLDYPARRNSDGSFDALEHHKAVELAMPHLGKDSRIAAIGSPRASLEANYLLQQLAGEENTSPGFSDTESVLVNKCLAMLQATAARIPSLREIETADAILILGEDVTNTAPRIALALRQAVRNEAFKLADQLQLAHWQDAAIRNLAQEQRSPLYSLLSGNSRLDDIACHVVSATPAQIAQHAVAITSALDSKGASDDSQAASIAASLLSAQRPLIVSGTGAHSLELLDAVEGLCESLLACNSNTMLSLSVPECNSLGIAMLAADAAPTLTTLAQRAEAGDIDTLVVLENELPRRGQAETVERLLRAVPYLLVIECRETVTAACANLVLPAASFAESEGTLVSSEARAQRHYPVFTPPHERQPAWAWLAMLGHRSGRTVFAKLRCFDDVSAQCAANNQQLAAITQAAPQRDYRYKGLRVPRQPHRYSGRTAMHADVSVHEPKQSVDTETPLAYSMEGLNRHQQGSLLPFVWAPGWNSNQSVHKFQQEIGGPLRGGTAGKRLLDEVTRPRKQTVPGDSTGQGDWLLVPRYRIFGSEELSVLSDAIAELAGNAYAEINQDTADILGVAAGDGLVLAASPAIEVRINNSLPARSIGYTAGYQETLELQGNTWVSACRASDWSRSRPDLIGSDRGRDDV